MQVTDADAAAMLQGTQKNLQTEIPLFVVLTLCHFVCKKMFVSLKEIKSLLSACSCCPPFRLEAKGDSRNEIIIAKLVEDNKVDDGQAGSEDEQSCRYRRPSNGMNTFASQSPHRRRHHHRDDKEQA